MLAEADGHTGHFPVRLRGARHDDPLGELVAGDGRATEPFEKLVRSVVGRLRGTGTETALPTFADGVAVLRVAEAVDGGRP